MRRRHRWRRNSAQRLRESHIPLLQLLVQLDRLGMPLRGGPACIDRVESVQDLRTNFGCNTTKSHEQLKNLVVYQVLTERARRLETTCNPTGALVVPLRYRCITIWHPQLKVFLLFRAVCNSYFYGIWLGGCCLTVSMSGRCVS